MTPEEKLLDSNPILKQVVAAMDELVDLGGDISYGDLYGWILGNALPSPVKPDSMFEEHTRRCQELNITLPKETDVIADTTLRIKIAERTKDIRDTLELDAIGLKNTRVRQLEDTIIEADAQLRAMEGINLLSIWSKDGDEPALRQVLEDVLMPKDDVMDKIYDISPKYGASNE